MTRDEFNHYCESLPSTAHVVQWGGADVWKVGGKVFAVGGWSKNDSLAVTFKASEHNYEVLKDRNGFQPAPYLASRGMKWIQQTDTSSELENELKYYIDESHRIVAMGLSKVKRKELGLYQE